MATLATTHVHTTSITKYAFASMHLLHLYPFKYNRQYDGGECTLIALVSISVGQQIMQGKVYCVSGI
jgi:hypothetical protein